METFITRMSYIFPALIVLVAIICLLLIDIWINRLLNLQRRWNTELKDKFLDWYWQMKKKAALHRISVNRYKMQRLANVEEEATPEIIAIIDRINEDIEFVHSYDIEEPADMDLAIPITEDAVSLTTAIFDKIDEMILLETERVLLPLASLGKNIDVLYYGDYVRDVGEAVQAGLNLGVYKTNLVFKPEYINSYIVKKSSVLVLTTMTNLNKQLPPPE